MSNFNQVNISLTSIGHHVDDDPRRISMFNLEKKKEDPKREFSATWYLLFPVVFIIWPFIRLFYSKQISFIVAMACNSLTVMFCIFIRHSVPTIYCVYFYIIYCGTVFTEYYFFLSTPYEGFRKTTKKTIDFYEGLFSTEVMTRTFGRFYKIQFVIAILLPIITGAFIKIFNIKIKFDNNILDHADDADGYDDYNGNVDPDYLDVFTFYSNYQYYEKVSDQDDFAEGFEDHPASYLCACVALFCLTVYKSFEIGVFYKTIFSGLTEVGEELDKTINNYNNSRIYETCIYLKNTTVKWNYNIKAFMMVDYSQTLSLIALIGLFGLLLYSTAKQLAWSFVPASYMDLTMLAGSMIITILIATIMFIWKLFSCYSIRSCTQKVNDRFENIDKQLSQITQAPRLFIKTTRNNRPFDPSHEEIVKWSEISFDEKNYSRLFDDSEENFMVPLLRSIEKKENVSNINFREAERLISENARSSMETFDLLKKDYEDLIKVVEYKFFGVFEVDTALLVQVSGIALTSLVTFLHNYAGTVFGENSTLGQFFAGDLFG